MMLVETVTLDRHLFVDLKLFCLSWYTVNVWLVVLFNAVYTLDLGLVTFTAVEAFLCNVEAVHEYAWL